MNNTVIENIFANKSVSLLGAGVSNMPLARVVAPLCSRLTVRDMKTPEALGAIGDELISLGAELITGDGYLDGINEDLVFRSPGIRPDVDGLTAARERGSVITSEMELFLSRPPCPVYAITGSDGKTTTTTLTSLLLMPEGKVVLGGNIGEPLLYRYDKISSADAVAVELSSFQLMTIDAKIDVAAITNITPNHLNWHTGMDEYISAKKNLLKNCARAVLNYDNDITRAIAAEMQEKGTPVTFFSLAPIPDGVLGDGDSAVWLENDVIYSLFPGEGKVRIMNRSEIKLPGLHNTANYMTAIAVTHGMTTVERIKEVASTFGGVEHRLEFVRELDGVTYINGSIDSSPTRTGAALSALSDRPLVLISGGYDKHIPYEPLADAIFSSTVHTAVLTGATAKVIHDSLLAHEKYDERVEKGFSIVLEPDFDTAVLRAKELAHVGDTVILSPASASFDRFKNFEERGRHFKELVRGL